METKNITEVKATDILDQVKEAEAIMRKRMLLKQISELKKLCKKVLETKKECEMTLTECNVSEEDAKRLIDYLNSLPEVQLKKEDISAIRAKIKKKAVEVSEEIKKEAEKYPPYIGYTGVAGTNWTNAMADKYTVSYSAGTTGSTGATGITGISGATNLSGASGSSTSYVSRHGDGLTTLVDQIVAR